MRDATKRPRKLARGRLNKLVVIQSGPWRCPGQSEAASTTTSFPLTMTIHDNVTVFTTNFANPNNHNCLAIKLHLWFAPAWNVDLMMTITNVWRWRDNTGGAKARAPRQARFDSNRHLFSG